MTDRYTLAQRVLHWLIAVLVVLSLIGGATLWAYGFDGLNASFGLDVTNAIYKYHKTAGVLILGLMTVRLALRLTVGAPEPVPTLTPFERTASWWLHRAFYAALILMAVLGWAATAAGGFPIEFFDYTLPPILSKDPALSAVLYRAHGLLGLILLGMIVLHVAGALRHWLVTKDGVMRRMSLP